MGRRIEVRDDDITTITDLRVRLIQGHTERLTTQQIVEYAEAIGRIIWAVPCSRDTPT